MRMYFKSNKRGRGNESSIPNVLAFGFIKNFLTDKQYEEMREEYYVNNLSSSQINQVMKDVKWLFRTYKDLDVMTIETANGDITKFKL